ncbi:TetR/AcrR family transcriptional regulator [Umezawaea sp. NPDC059074]|uniref:TetR/AcrR family transcriptional regulator n=1 Tax=Umezawaea sp. NPDC059074 TaxID=3346716 RepID=UPI00368FA6DE
MEPISLGRPREERSDAVRNRAHLIEVARLMVDELGVDKVTMDGLAERAGLGKGTVFRRFGTRAGIFHALFDREEQEFQQRVLSGPPPLGPGAPAVDRLVEYGRARVEFLVRHLALARAAIAPGQPVPSGPSPSQFHVQVLLREACPDVTEIGTLALQLTAALEYPIVLHLSAPEGSGPSPVPEHLADTWKILVDRLCR